MKYELTQIPLDNSSLLLHETLFHNANGYIGVRGCFEEGYPDGFTTVRGLYSNGFYDIIEMKQAEQLYGLVNQKQTTLNLADIQGIHLYIGGERFSMFDGEVLDSSRTLDMERGVTTRCVRWRSPKGHEVDIEIIRMASFTHLSIFTIDYRVTSVNFSGEVRFVSEHLGDVRNFCDPNDPRTATESVQNLFVESVEVVAGCSFITSNTSRSGQSVCVGVCNVPDREFAGEITAGEHSVVQNITVQIAAGETVRNVKYTAVADTVHHGNAYKDAAKQALHDAIRLGADILYDEQKKYQERVWQNCEIKISGDDNMNLAMGYNTYQLIQSVSKDGFGNIAAKGLSGEGYEGHYFWDTEMYLQPFFVLTMPELCKNLIAFRYRTLDRARENARILGHKSGALYPWRTISGDECSGYYVSGSAAYHINGAVGHSVAQYYLATGDMSFLAEMGAEILFEIARLWLDVGCFYDGKFHINAVTGPDEYTCMVNNNYYTNMLAQQNLRWAAKAYGLLSDKDRKRLSVTDAEVESWLSAADAMVMLYDEKLGINPQDDSFLQKNRWDFDGTPPEKHPLLLHYHPLHLYRYQVCKQADTVLAYFIAEQSESEQVMRRSYEYYEAITTHDSSLSSCIFSIVASMLGEKEKATRYFGDSALLDLFNTHKNTKDGIHCANMGGCYMALVYGFAGLRIREDGLHFRPLLPDGWDGYTFRANYRGALVELTVTKDGNQLKLLDGQPKNMFINGEKVAI